MGKNKCSSWFALLPKLFHRGAIFLCLSLIFFSLIFATPPPPQRERGDRRISLDYSDILEYDAANAPGIQKLIGNVQLSHQNWIMRCDSAYFKEEENQFEAFGAIRITEGDSISITGKYLFYDGNSKIAQLRNTVELRNSTAVLYTDSLDYDRNLDVGYYFETGTIVDSLNTLTSIYGEYTPQLNEAIFKNMVELVHPDFTLNTDYLRYNTKSKIAYFRGPTTIQSDSGSVESTRGVYDTEKDVSILLDRSVVYQKRGTITGDSLLYDRKNKFAESFGSMILSDTINKAILKGEYGYYDENKEYAFTTQRASLIDYSRPDTLYMGADTLENIQIKKGKESIRLSRAYHHVRLFRKDIQAIADSARYFTLDSTLVLYQNPILWQEQSQVQGDTVKIYFIADTIDRSIAYPNAKVMREVGENKYEQVKGDSLLTFFADSTVREIRVHGNAEMIYYAQQEALKRFYALGHIKSPQIISYIEGDTLRKTHWQGAVEGKIYPIEQVTDDIALLPGLSWKSNLRPQSPNDIFRAKRDSLGAIIPYSPQNLSDLNRFSGAYAAKFAYETLEKEITLYTPDPPTEPISEEDTSVTSFLSSQLPQYIRRPAEDDLPWQSFSYEQLFKNNPLSTLWDSFSSTATESQDNSDILPSIGTPPRKQEKSE
ncbi:OstA-like protein [Porphyromonas circumdentaria]|uniref:OstA-like protein n=1 Tax=Porphyromonas circumdentaria TaxID=29524 RepID=A0A1T4PEV7_9PORP|nr:OstA-like protein [Porphyromonas circumdentaria]MBB6275700.1 lipopolysaccharide export system protein LptA [Porphyromonas circumdentaria]MDO4723037.1 OstA-like protein [Porphyromonas circumdentaria]SJZ90084.1 OstA-like protein [Porphyromonas circumdentaria]